MKHGQKLTIQSTFTPTTHMSRVRFRKKAAIKVACSEELLHTENLQSGRLKASPDPVRVFQTIITPRHKRQKVDKQKKGAGGAAFLEPAQPDWKWMTSWKAYINSKNYEGLLNLNLTTGLGAKSIEILLCKIQAWPGRTVKQEHKEISPQR